MIVAVDLSNARVLKRNVELLSDLVHRLDGCPVPLLDDHQPILAFTGEGAGACDTDVNAHWTKRNDPWIEPPSYANPAVAIDGHADIHRTGPNSNGCLDVSTGAAPSHDQHEYGYQPYRGNLKTCAEFPHRQARLLAAAQCLIDEKSGTLQFLCTE